MNRYLWVAIYLAVASVPVSSRQDPGAHEATPTVANSSSALSAAAAVSGNYVLGPGDQLTLAVPNLEESFNGKIFRIDGSGETSLPFVGRVHAAGMTTEVLEKELMARLSSVLKSPAVVVTIAGFGSQPVSVLGSVKNPGVIQLQGRKTLFDILSLAGGLDPQAGYALNLTRPLTSGAIPLPGVQTDETGGVGLVSVKLQDLLDPARHGVNIQVLPGDSIFVPKADLVYAVGWVTKPGAFPLSGHESLSALQVVSLAEGLSRTSAASKAKILRSVPGSANRTEIPVNLKRMLTGKSEDVQLHSGDILFVPGSSVKAAAFRTGEAVMAASSYGATYAKF